MQLKKKRLINKKNIHLCSFSLILLVYVNVIVLFLKHNKTYFFLFIIPSFLTYLDKCFDIGSHGGELKLLLLLYPHIYKIRNNINNACHASSIYLSLRDIELWEYYSDHHKVVEVFSMNFIPINYRKLQFLNSNSLTLINLLYFNNYLGLFH